MNSELASVEAVLQGQIEVAKASSIDMSILSEAQKNQALEILERELLESMNMILEANAEDIKEAQNADHPAAYIDRLTLNVDRIQGMAQGIRKIRNAPDPIGNIIDGWKHPLGFQITKTRVPLGVIGIIYEARPNVTTDAVALAIKSGNALVLRGSKQTWHSNTAIMQVVYRALEQTLVPAMAIQYLKDKSRSSANFMLKAEGLIDLIIPRGGECLNEFVTETATIPVLGAGGGICHTYIDEFADADKAISVAVNAKAQRCSVCNSCETILVHESQKDTILPMLCEQLSKAGVQIIGDEAVQAVFPLAIPATEEDWASEYLDMKVSIKVVANLKEAIQHINKYSTGHSEAIITEKREPADLFKRMIDSACVYVNVSTRFTDGEEFGYGAEMGISTQKMHARGPIGLKELCSYKFYVEGEGQIRS